MIMPNLKRDHSLDLNAVHRAFSFQKEAVDAVKDLEYAGVFHEQGLGKTKIAIDILLYWLSMETVDSVVIVTKKGLVPNWLRELKTHTNLSAKVIGSNRSENFLNFNSPARVYVTNYEALVSEGERFALFVKTRKLGAIMDESQKIKNPKSKNTSAALDLSSEFARRLILTGTPIANRPYDIWSQIYFLDQGNSLGKNFDDFKDLLDLPKDSDRNIEQTKIFERSLRDLYGKLSEFCVRETKQGSQIELPEKIIRNVECEWENRQSEMYRSIQRDLSIQVSKDGKLIEDDAEEILKRLLRLVQAASNPALIDDSYQSPPGKFEYLNTLVDQITDAGEKAIIWSSFTENVDWLAAQLRHLGTRRVHGKMNYEERGRSINSFLEDPAVRLLLATPGAAKEGFTLTVANHVIFYDRGFSLDDYLQAQDRIHRISQERNCYVHNLVLRNSIDEWVDLLLTAKSNAASLGMGDIDEAEYAAVVDYSFNDIVAEILSPESLEMTGK